MLFPAMGFINQPDFVGDWDQDKNGKQSEDKSGRKQHKVFTHKKSAKELILFVVMKGQLTLTMPIIGEVMLTYYQARRKAEH
jgi:hypothetical protein